MTDREAMKLALEALEFFNNNASNPAEKFITSKAIAALHKVFKQIDFIEAAVLAEREACAVECDKWAAVKPSSDFMHGSASGARQCAAAIRERMK